MCRVLWRCGGKATGYMVWRVKKRLRNSNCAPWESRRSGGVINDGNFGILPSDFRLTEKIITIKGC